ncbi:DNA polymerase III subunit beta [Actinoplanes sp. URMC 104]|uniref:DNA polymerase III subunit beta n=1 Tax=Actinoplanes sp. URMC 104 TaxID=3423409 RepID=UPI003F1B74A1
MSTTTQASAKLSFTVPQPELAAALAFVAKSIPNRPAVPVLAGLVLASDGEAVVVEAFDYEQARRVTLPGAKLAQAGSVLVSAAKLTAIVKKLPKGRPVALTDEGANLRVSNGASTLTVPTMPIEDYPTRPDMPPVVGVVDAKPLAVAVAQVAKHAGKDETLPMMTGVRLEADADSLALLATDRFRLALRELPWAGEGAFEALPVGRQFAEVTAAMVKLGGGAAVTIAHEQQGTLEGWLGVECGSVRVVMRLLDGTNYPPIRKVIPATFAYELDVNVADLVDTAERISPVLGKADPVVLRFADDALVMQGGRVPTDDAYDDSLGGAAEDVDCEVVAAAGEPFALGVNPAYLADALKTTGVKRVRLGVVDASKPVTVKPLDADGDVLPGVTNVLMAVRLEAGYGAPIATPREQAAGAGTAKAAKAAKAKPVTPTPAAPAKAEPTPAAMAEAVAQAQPQAGEGVLDRTVPHAFVAAVQDGRAPNATTKCRCGTTLRANVHKAARQQAAADAAAAAKADEPNPLDGLVHMVVMQVTVLRAGQFVPEATVAGVEKVIDGYGRERVLASMPVEDEHGKRVFVALATQQDAERLHGQALGAGIPAHTALGEWPSNGSAAGITQEGTHVKQQEKSPVIVSEPKLDVNALSIEAFAKLKSGDFAGALELVDTGAKLAPQHRFVRSNQTTFGWADLRKAIEFKLSQEGIAVQAQNDALAAAARDEAAEVDGEDEVADAAGADAELADDEPVEIVVPEPEPERVEVVLGDAAGVSPIEARLREAMAGMHPAVIEAAVSGALAVAGVLPQAEVDAVPQPVARAKAAAKPSVEPGQTRLIGAAQRAVAADAAAKPKPAPVVQAAAGVDEGEWAAFGVAAPTNVGGKRTYVLPVGTRLKAMRSGVMACLRDDMSKGALVEMPTVTLDKEARPNKLLVVEFPGAGNLKRAIEAIDDAVIGALQECAPQRANA